MFRSDRVVLVRNIAMNGGIPAVPARTTADLLRRQEEKMERLKPQRDTA